MTKKINCIFGVFVCIFDSMLRIFIMLTRLNRELFICVCVRMILNLMTNICMVFFSVFMCFDGIVAENQRVLIYKGPWMLWTTWTLGAMWITQKNPMLKFSGFHNPETLKPYVNPDYIIRTRMLWVFVCLSLMTRVSVDRYMNLTQAAMQLQGSYERSTMTVTPPTPLKNNFFFEEKRWNQEWRSLLKMEANL